MTKRSFAVVSILACAALFSCSRPLDRSSEVVAALQAADEGLKAAAESSGIKLEQKVDPRAWYPRLLEDAERSGSADLYGADWGRELFLLSKEGGLADSDSAWKKSDFARGEPAWFKSLPVGPRKGFIPVSAYVWGLFFNEKLLSELGGAEPATIEELEALFAKAKAAGKLPIALGSAFGWPGAAWFTILDLRTNGAAAVRERYAGTRRWDEEGAVAIAEKLASWRDLGYFSEAAPGLGMAEALSAVEAGESLCVLSGSFSVERLARPDGLRFLPFPPTKPGAAKAEIAGLSGFALPKAAAKEAKPDEARLRQEASIALLDAYLGAGEAGRRDGYRVPLAYVSGRQDKKGSAQLPALEGIKALQAGMLKQAEDLVPAFDRIVDPQALQNSISLWKAFFGAGGTKGRELVEALQRAMDTGR